MTMTPAPNSRQVVPLPMVMEETGLSTRRAGQPHASTAATSDAMILSAAADLLRASLPAEFLDPFAPVEARDQAVAAVLRAAIADARMTGGILGRLSTDMDQLKQVFAQTIGWGPAQRYLDDPTITEVKIIGTTIMVQEIGSPFAVVNERFESEADVTSRAKLLADLLGVTLDANHPQQSLPLAHGTRMHVTIAPAVTNGTNVMIRRGRSYPWTLDDLLGRGAMDGPTADLLRLFCRAKASVLVIGSTGSGKTTFMESLANSWEGQPHILTIEDGVQEIKVRPNVPWTREQVNTTKDPNDFSLKAREALRQTPGLLLPGETRSYEAGAILSLLTSDHPTMTTIHALSATDGLERFASCAALPQSYMYANRRNDALRDTTSAFDVAVFVENLADTGRRVVSEIVLSRGVKEGIGGLLADTIPLVQHDIDADGNDVWIARARVQNDDLVWHDEDADHTPHHLRIKLRRARKARNAIKGTGPSVDGSAEAIKRAEGFLATSNGLRALEALRGAWNERRDERVLQVAHRAMALLSSSNPAAVAEWTTKNQYLTQKISSAINHSRWNVAAATLKAALDQLEIAAVIIPAGGWASVGRQVEMAKQVAKTAETVLSEARDLINSRQSRAALQRIDAVAQQMNLLELSMQYALMEARVLALRELVAIGDANAFSLESAEARLQGLKAIVDADAQHDGGAA